MKISKGTIKKIIRNDSKIRISDEAAEMIVKILEKKAESIAKHAVSRAKEKKRDIILLEDIEDYKLKKTESLI